VHDCLGMTLDFSVPGQVTVTILTTLRWYAWTSQRIWLAKQPLQLSIICSEWPSIVSCVTTIIMWITTKFNRTNWCITWDCCEI
jgi:hypothetical protein